MAILQYAPLCLAILVFGYYLFDPDEKRQRFGAVLRWATVLASTAMVIRLFALFLGRRYEFAYVFENSSQDLEFIYRFSAVWAGQAGTFLLWYWFTALLLVFMVRPQDMRNQVWCAVGFVLVLIGVFLAIESPFALVSREELETLRSQMARGMLAPGFLNSAGLPADGQGLNPILKNPWMAIHPPLIFIGYGLAAAPFALAAAAVAKRQINSWAHPARIWSALAWAFLGAGIFCGSYWAYIILGWGGYWGWDPVENASLLPWIALAALSHGLIIQGGGKRFSSWNLLLAFVPLAMVFVTTFLTRSGALAEFSVHSFQKSLLFYPIAMTLAAVCAVSLGLWIFALGARIATNRADSAPKWGHRLLSWTIVLMIMLLGFVMLGTLFPLLSGIPVIRSLPMISGMAAGGAATVDQSYYNKTTFFSMFLIGGILIACPFLFVRAARGAAGRARTIAGTLGAIAGAALLAASAPKASSGTILVLSYALALMAGATAAINIANVLHFYRLKNWSLGGYTVHAGVGLLTLGVLTTSFGSREQQVSLSTGQTVKGKIAEVTLTNVEFDAKHEQGIAILDIRRGAKTQIAAVRFNVGETRRAPTPTILSSLASDLYIIPESFSAMPGGMPGGGMPQAAPGMGMMDEQDLPEGDTVTRTQSVRAGQAELLLIGWDLASGGMEQGSLNVQLQITDASGQRQITAPFNAMGGAQNSPAITLDDGTKVRVLRINVNKRQPDQEFAVLEIIEPQSRAPRMRPGRYADPYIIQASFSVAQAPEASPEPGHEGHDHEEIMESGAVPGSPAPETAPDAEQDVQNLPPGHPPMPEGMDGMGSGMPGGMQGMGDMGGMGGAMPPGHPPAGMGGMGGAVQVRILTKPFVVLLWLGMLLITAGAAAASLRGRGKSKAND
jgi:cytochrome c-type biogenesis protein CcmF